MRKPVKIILSTLASLLLLIVVAVAVLPFAVNLDDFKNRIETAIQENTGRAATIDGDLEVSIFPWLGLETGSLTLSNTAHFTEQSFAQISHSQIKVKLLPLLFNQVEISEIVLSGLTLTLIKNPQGDTNWDDLVTLIRQRKEQDHNPLKLLEIAGLEIEDAQIVWDDQQQGKRTEIKELNLKTDKLSFNQPIELAFSFMLNNTQPGFTETIDFSSHLMLTEQLDSFELKNIQLQTRTKSEFVPAGDFSASLLGNASFDLHRQQLKLSALTVKSGELTIAAATLTTELKSPFTVEGLIHVPTFDAAKFIRQHTQFQLPKMVDEKALSWIAADFALHADQNGIKLQDLAMQIDETNIKGVVQINNFAAPAVNFNLALDIVNFDRYLPPPPKEENAVFFSTTPINTAAVNASVFPIESLRKLNANGQVTINDLKVNNLTMQQVRLLLNAKQGQLQSWQSANRFYQGAFSSKVALDVSRDQPVLNLTQQLSHVQIEPLLTDMNGHSALAGLVSINAKLATRGNSDNALKASLNGRLSFFAKDLLIRGFNLQKMIDNGKILLSGETLASHSKKDQTSFSKMTGTAVISNGIISNNDLLATANKAKVGGMGILNLVSQQVDYKFIAILLKNQLAATQAKLVNNLPIFINIGGTLTEPAYQVDLAAMGVAL
jgi:AsmA protein